MKNRRACVVALAATALTSSDGLRAAPLSRHRLFASALRQGALGAVCTLNLAAGHLRGEGLPVEHHVPFTPETAIIGHFSATKKPVLTIKSGATVRIDCGGGARWRDEDPNAWLKENNIPATIETNVALAETVRVLKETPHRLPATPSPTASTGSAPVTGAMGLPVPTGGHLLVGPIFIEGAEPGDSLEIRILEVTPRIPYGTVGATPGRGALPDMVPRPWSKVVPLDLARNAGIFDANVHVPLAPFNGVMGTCPPDSEPNRRSGPPGLFGGNLDCKELVAGTTLYLPIFQKGALFYTGDCHAAQGDGEITINAIETANTAAFQFILHKGKTLAAPRAETPTHYLTFGLDPNLEKAMRMAMIETVDFLKEKRGYDFFHAYALTSIGVDFRITQVVDGTQGIHAMIPKKLFLDEPNRYWYRSR
jgi:acetamidase/formamidase